MKQRKVLVGIAIAIFVILLLYWLLVAEDMKPVPVNMEWLPLPYVH